MRKNVFLLCLFYSAISHCQCVCKCLYEFCPQSIKFAHPNGSIQCLITVTIHNVSRFFSVADSVRTVINPSTFI